MKAQRNNSAEVLATRSARMRAQMADPAYVAKIVAGRGVIWTPARRARQREIMAALIVKPAFKDKRKVGRRCAVPKHAHPAVRGLFSEINTQRAMLRDVEARAGIGHGTIRDWCRNNPGLSNLDAALNALDLELAIVPIGSRDDNGFVKKRAYRKRAAHEHP